MGTENHPVWDVYNEYRTALLNVKYYNAIISRFKNRNLLIEITLAVTSSSAVAGLWFWTSEGGVIIWKVLGVLTAVIAVVKPFLKYTEKIQACEEIFSGHRMLHHELQKLTISIHQDQKYSKKHRRLLESALNIKGDLISKSSSAKDDKKLKAKCASEILIELPVDDFYIPEEISHV